MSWAIDKFPVTSSKLTPNKQYRVDIGEDEHHFLPIFFVRVYEVKKKWRSWTTFKRVSNFETWNPEYKESVAGDYVSLAKRVVSIYEDRILERKLAESLHEKGVVEFERWDGRMD